MERVNPDTDNTVTPGKLRSDKLWKQTYDLVELMYKNADEITATSPEEKWSTAAKLRNAANDSLFYISQALGGGMTADTNEYDWSSARKNLFSVQTMYIFATKQKYIKLDPEVVVAIDKMLEIAESNIIASRREVENKKQKELEPWLEKYRLWKEMQ